MTREQIKRHDRKCLIILAIICMVLILHVTASTIRGNGERRKVAETKKAWIEQVHEGLTVKSNKGEAKRQQDTETEPDAFGGMSRDWGDGDLDGFMYYEIPEEYVENGGYFPEIMQIYTYCLCKQQNVRYSLILAVIERESGYRYDCTGDDGESVGYMQIMEKWHGERMRELGCTDLMNPYQNVRVGVDYLSELIERYGTIQDALAAYNYGEKGAKENLWSNGVYLYEYNETIMRRMKEIEEVLGNGF